MTPRKTGDGKAGTATQDAKVVLRLFVAGNESNSVQARENITRLCEAHLGQSYELEIVDVITDFGAALADNILVTPALVLVAPAPSVTILGTLRDTERVLATLRITAAR